MLKYKSKLVIDMFKNKKNILIILIIIAITIVITTFVCCILMGNNEMSNKINNKEINNNVSVAEEDNEVEEIQSNNDDLENKNRNKITDILLMVQEEVARRMTATEKSPSKQYGLLTILSQFWADVEIKELVGRRSFYPAPKVNSALVSLKVQEKPKLNLTDYTHFRKTVKSAFSQRRKNIKNCLLSGGFSKESIQRAIQKLGLDENIRGEKLSIEELGKLSEELKNGN